MVTFNKDNLMYQLTNYIDSEHIIIDPNNNIAYYCYKGSSYRDKIKNGLTLEQVYEQEELYLSNETKDCENVTQVIKKNDCKSSNVYDDDVKDVIISYKKNSKGRKGEKVKGEKEKKKNTKISVRQNGYSDKMFMLNQYIPDEFDSEKHESFYNSVPTIWLPSCLCPECNGGYDYDGYVEYL